MMFLWNFLLSIVASSYLTLGIFQPTKAKDLWWEYAITVFVLTLINLWVTRRSASAGSKAD